MVTLAKKTPPAAKKAVPVKTPAPAVKKIATAVKTTAVAAKKVAPAKKASVVEKPNLPAAKKARKGTTTRELLERMQQEIQLSTSK